MNIEQTFTVLRREQLLIDHAPHSVQFQDLTDSLLRVCSAAAVIPALSALEIRLYSTLALLHDVGKRAIPPEILNKPGSLTREEFEVMKSHTTQGCDLLERVPELRECEAFPAICDVCRHHHERWDGTGYPDRLQGQDITPWVQVVGLADAFDALVHPRVYKPAFTQQQAGEMIVTGACGAFDPLLLACFAQHIGAICQAVYPPRWLRTLLPTLGRNTVIAQFQQRDDLAVRNGIVQDNGDPVVLVHVICREKSFCGEQGADHDGAAFNIHNIKGFHSRQAQLFREDAHQGGVPFLAGRMTEYCVARAVGPKVLRLRPISILYVLRDALTLRRIGHFISPSAPSAALHTPAAPPQSPHGRRTCRSRGIAPAVWRG